MKMKQINYVGAKRHGYLPAHMPFEVKLINHPRFNSNQFFNQQKKSTFHDTGNPRSNANGEWAWAAAGRPGGVVGGYQFIVDDKHIFQTDRLDRISWHAGSPLGNQSFGTEMAFGGNVVWVNTLENTCALHASLLEMHGLAPDDVVLHQWWTGKWCAAQILNRGLWPTVLQKVRYYWQLCRDTREGKSVPTPEPETPYWPYAPQKPVTFQDGKRWDGTKNAVIEGTKYYAQKGKVRTTVALRRRQDASTDSPEVGPVLAAGTEIDVLGWEAGEIVSGISEWWITPGGTRFWAGGIDEKPIQVPDYGELPAQVPGMKIINGHPYYPLLDDNGNLGRKMFIINNGNIRRWASVSSPITGTVKKGEERTFYYWTRGDAVTLNTPDGPVEEMIWYSLKPELSGGDRVWAGLTGDRPD